jgi:hypothetical protein
MAVGILVLGPCGSGKTFSAGTLNPKSTVYINSDKKSMPFKGWREVYNAENKNYIVSSNALDIAKYIQVISDKAPHVKVILIDTISSIMSDKEMAEIKKKAYDKWIDYAADIYELFKLTQSEVLREDLYIVFLGHTEEWKDNHVVKHRMKSGGAKLTNLNVEGKLTYTLYTEIEFNEGKPEYYFITQSDGTTTARSPFGCFERKIPNDLGYVIKRIDEFEHSKEPDEIFKNNN